LEGKDSGLGEYCDACIADRQLRQFGLLVEALKFSSVIERPQACNPSVGRSGVGFRNRRAALARLCRWF
jgi:hypothetical protein